MPARFTEWLRARVERALLALWFPAAGPAPRPLALVLLWPLAALTARVARRRRAGIRRRPPGERPHVIVVGNLVVGGTGKTPATIALADALSARGWTVGLLAGGYRARRADARLVAPESGAGEHGDEPVLLARQTRLPVAAGRRRGEALALLTRSVPGLQVVISDDGLQHPGLPRATEVAVFDRRGAGNGRLLPAGPLREPLDDLTGMDALLLNGDADPPAPRPRAFRFRVAPVALRPLRQGRPLTPAAFARLALGRAVTAVAGIAQPRRFFDALRGIGLVIEEHALPDHAIVDADWLAALPGDLVVMTSKDAVKCEPFADDRCWCLDAAAEIEPAFIDWIEERLRGQPIA